MTALSGALIPFKPEETACQYYVKFTNAENSTVYVPITSTDSKKLDSCLGKSVICQLDKKLRKISKSTVPELSPLLRPDAQMVLNGNYRTYKWLRRSNRIIRPTERMQSKVPIRRVPSLNFEATEESFDLNSLERLCKAFISRRAELNLVQSEVSRSFARLYGVHRSTSLISRFERMKLSLSNFLKVCPVLYQWVKDTETEEGRRLVLQAARENSPIEALNSPSSTEIQNLSNLFVKRRQRRNLSREVREALEEAYWKNPDMSSYEVKHLADALNVDVARIRQWVYNRRSMDRNKDILK